MTLEEYVIEHTERGECQCGRCADRGTAPDPTGHTVDTGFFKVAATNSPTADELRRLTDAHVGVYVAMDPFDGLPHSYVEVGAWIGDQGLGMQFMALATLLGLTGLLPSPNGPVILPVELAQVLGRHDTR